MKSFSKFAYTTGMSLILASCAHEDESLKLYSEVNDSAPLKSVASNKKADPAVVAAVHLIKKQEYKKASQIINAKLQDDPTNVAMHILNGLTYEKLASRGDSGRLDLAIIGYESALNIDPNNQFALQRLAHLRFKKHEFSKAQELYANALLLKPEDPALLQELAASSYYAYDLKTAQISIEKAVSLQPKDILAQRSAAMIYAALGDFDQADKHFEEYKTLAADEESDIKVVSNRMNDWKNLYNSGRIYLAQSKEFPAFTTNQEGDTVSADLGEEALKQNPGKVEQPPKASPQKAASKPEKTQIIIDCYLLRIEETAGTSKGNNILENLQVTLAPGGYLFGRSRLWGDGVIAKNEALNNSEASTLNTVTPEANFATGATGFGTNATSFTLNTKGNTNFTTFVGGLTWSGLSYNLNIANVRDNRTEVVARPSLHTFLNEESVFFSGTELVTGLIGSEGGNIVKYPVGVTLVVTPTDIDEETGIITLSIAVEGAEFNQPNVVQDLSNSTVNVGKTRIDTKAKVKLGQTLALGGIYERVEVYQKQGVPGLSDVPLVQYLFSNEQSTTDRRSVVILMTPRSPETTKQDIERAIAEDRSKPFLDELERRNKDWFTTSPNLAKIFTYMSVDPVIYREFRSVDVLPPSWGEPDNFFEDGWAMFSSFMYY